LPIRKKITVVRLKTHFVPAGLLASLYHAYYQYFVRRVADSPPKEGRNIGRIKATPESAKSATGGRDILSVLEHSKWFYRTVIKKNDSVSNAYHIVCNLPNNFKAK